MFVGADRVQAGQWAIENRGMKGRLDAMWGRQGQREQSSPAAMPVHR